MSIEDKIRDFIQLHLFMADHPLGDDASFLDEGIVDSTGVFELVAFVEAEFGIKVQTYEVVVSNFDSVGQLANFVRRKLSGTRQCANREGWESPADAPKAAGFSANSTTGPQKNPFPNTAT
jgi:acyl carrier protein